MGKMGKKFFDVIGREKKALSSFGVRRIGLFGSCLRGDDKIDSDIDVLVEFEKKSFDAYMDLKFLLEDALGRKIDLVIIDSIKPALRDEILKEVKYAA